MLNQMLTLGLRHWHAVWGPVKTWADHHQDHNGNALQFFASLTTVVGLPILTLLLGAALVFLIADRVDARRQRSAQRRAVLLLHELRLRILKANGLVNARLASPRATRGVGAGFSGDGADRLSRQIQDQFESITCLCDSLLARLTVADPAGPRHKAPPRAARVATFPPPERYRD